MSVDFEKIWIIFFEKKLYWHFIVYFDPFFEQIKTNNLFVTSKIETTNSPINEFKVLPNVFKMKMQGLKCFLK